MSILNLNAPQGRGSIGKKKTKIWMGVGLLAAVLGFGSTLAANIQINNNQISEFGQGVTQTVYCGGEETITVRAISSFVNSTSNPGSDAVPATWTSFTGTKGSFVKVDDDSSSKYRSYVRYQNPATGAYIVDKAGYWIKTRNSSGSSDLYKNSASTTPPSDYPIFVPQERDDGDYGYYRYTNWVDGNFSGGQDAVPPSSTPTKFEFGGVSISDIPSACSGKDFIISAYGSGANPLELSDVLDAKEIVVAYFGVNTTPPFSFDRTTLGTPNSAVGKVTVSADDGSIKVLFTSAAGRLLADSVTKVVIETQEEAID
jgi:hypothetical protein